MTVLPQFASESSPGPGAVIVTAITLTMVVLYASVQWFFLRPDFIQTWREADTQTIARHFTEPGANIFYPRIDWGGTGPGYVETEFQLYPWLVSLLLRVAGAGAEWPGQLLSLLAVVATAWLAYAQLLRRYGAVAAALGASALLASRGVLQSGTSVQPEALCLLLFAVAWFALLEYTDSGRRQPLVIYALSGAAAMLVKPTAAQLGIASFVLLFLRGRHLLTKKDVWIAWAFMVGALLVHLLHARNIYLEYGNTFGVLSGGDSKLPRLEHLLVPRIYLTAAHNAVNWGVGWVGAAALVIAVISSRKNTASIVALFVGVVLWTVLALRYTSSAAGNHYHLLGAVLAAQAIAHVVAALPLVRWRVCAEALIAIAIAAQFTQSYNARRWSRSNHPFDVPVVAVSQVAARHVAPGDLIAVRSVNPGYDTYWKTANNFEDPRVFYLTHAHGWPIPKDLSDASRIETALQQGARFYIETEPRAAMPQLDAWLNHHARLVESTSYGGKVYALRTVNK